MANGRIWTTDITTLPTMLPIMTATILVQTDFQLLFIPANNTSLKHCPHNLWWCIPKRYRSWAVDSIKLHVQRNGTRVLENVSNDGTELQGSMGRLMNPGERTPFKAELLLSASNGQSNNLSCSSSCFEHFVNFTLGHNSGLHFWLKSGQQI